MGFRDFPEQRQVTELLQRSLERGRLAHGYLFSGDTLEELEAMALTLAKTLNCASPVRRTAGGLPVDSCDKCSSCRRIDAGQHPDIGVVRPESKSRIISVDQMRDLMQTLNLKPTEAGFKVGVIAGADRLNASSANAFLKTLEEPPAKSILILLTTEPQRILETVVSRCLRLNFAGGGGVPKFHPEWIAQIGVTAANLKHGMIGRYQLLGVLLNKLGETKTEIEKVVSARSPLERHDDIDPKLREKWEDELSAGIEAEYRRQRSEILAGLQWWLRDVWLKAEQLGDEFMSFPDLQANTSTVAGRISGREALENLQVLEQTQRILFTNAQEALVLEVGLLKLKL
ncbi:MAG: hypothetical protein H7X97_01675 [Opitutaceae bacterium]|nr:hypothetical protein [Verrucomicrobiales bacterium]